MVRVSGWCNLLVDAQVASSGTARSFLHASHVSKTKYAHKVTAAVLHMLMKKAHDHYSIDTQVPETFEAWREKREKDYPQFRFWSITLNLQLCVIRSAAFQLYKYNCINALLPWFFAMDHVNYARWLSVHLCDMLQLEDTNPGIFSRFNDEEFAISKTKRAFSSIGIDHAHEQNNKCVWRFVNSFLINLHAENNNLYSLLL